MIDDYKLVRVDALKELDLFVQGKVSRGPGKQYVKYLTEDQQEAAKTTVQLAHSPSAPTEALEKVVGLARAIVGDAEIGTSVRASDYAVHVNAQLWRRFTEALAALDKAMEGK